MMQEPPEMDGFIFTVFLRRFWRSNFGKVFILPMAAGELLAY